MESSDNSSWIQVRKRIFADSASQQREILSWASKKRAVETISIIGKEVSVIHEQVPVVRVGDCGVCRHRYLRLGVKPAEFRKRSEKIDFGALYTIDEVSKNGTWIRIRLQNGKIGWIESRSHFAISSGEHKVLSSLKRTSALNFLINAIAASPI